MKFSFAKSCIHFRVGQYIYIYIYSLDFLNFLSVQEHSEINNLKSGLLNIYWFKKKKEKKKRKKNLVPFYAKSNICFIFPLLKKTSIRFDLIPCLDAYEPSWVI